MHSPAERLAKSRRLIDGAIGLGNRLGIALVCCHQRYTEPAGDYDRQSIDTRFYTEKEFEDFVAAFRQHGIFVVPFFDENEFIAWVAADGAKKLNCARLLVFTSGASNPGLGAKSLVPAYCRLHGLEIVGPDAHTATIARHKFHFTQILSSCGVPVPQTWLFQPKTGWLSGESPAAGLRVLLKPCHEAASIGLDGEALTFVDGQLSTLLEQRCAEFRQSMVVQEFIAGEEFDVPYVLCADPFCLGPVGISLENGNPMGAGFLSYAITMEDRYGFYSPSAMQTGVVDQLATNTLRGAMALGLRDLVRLDFRVGPDGIPRAIDVSTSPYLSEHSAFAHAYKTIGGDIRDLPLLLVGSACERLGWA